MTATVPLLVRADSSEQMGTGHVMRCLALAQAAQDEGGRAVFAMAQCPAGVAERLRAENVELVNLSCEPGSPQDALATAKAAQSCGADWVVLDGYHFDAAYQAAVKRSGAKLLAMDDFGALDRYVADIVVNQDPIAEERLYRCRESYTHLLLGTDYTFLRREFRQFPRPGTRVPGTGRGLLLSFGGSDPGRLTERALAELEDVRIDGLETVVLVGPGNPRWEQLQAAARDRENTLAGRIRLRRDPPDIPQWMAWCDLAVIAMGSTIWELAYCRVPCIAVMVHEDQSAVTDVLVQRGACLSLGLGGRLAAGQMAESIASLCRSPLRREELSANLAAMVDGLGAQRVLAAMGEPSR